MSNEKKPDIPFIFDENIPPEVKKELIEKEKLNFNRHEYDTIFMNFFVEEEANSFLGKFFMDVTKVADFKVDTAYVSARKNGDDYDIVLGYNPIFMRSLSPRQQFGVIKHELYHLVFQHVFNRNVTDPKLGKLWNFATDMAINSIIGKENLPDFCLIPGYQPINPSTGKPVSTAYTEYIKQAKTMLSSDHYFTELRKIAEEQGDKSEQDIIVSSGLDSMDDHDGWGNLPEEVQEELREKVNGMIEDAARYADQNNTWGSVPFEIQDVIRKIISNEVNWGAIIRAFIGRVRSMDRLTSMKRINKKAPYVFPGIKRKNIAKFACFIDQSGSMSNDDISMLFSEMEQLSKKTEIDVYPFDTEIDTKNHMVWTKNSKHPRVRARCGGTDFDVIADFCNDRKNTNWSGIIILTDGYAPTMKAIRGAKVLWVITEGGTMDTVRSGDLAVKMRSKDNGTFKRY